MTPVRTLPFALAALVLAGACSAATEPAVVEPAAVEPVKPVKPGEALEALPRALTAGEQKVVASTNEFSFSLFQRLHAQQKDSNVFTSPLSASFALGMTMNGAANATLDQMKSTLGYTGAGEAAVNAGYRDLIALLKGLDTTVDVRIANSIWYEQSFPFLPSFLDAGRTFFGAQVQGLSFTNPAAVRTINDWVSAATAGNIPTIIEKIDPGQVMFLINAIYFKGSWRQRFDLARTQSATFRGVAGDQPMRLMQRTGKVRYTATPDFELVDLPYGNSVWSMTVLLPRQGKSVESIVPLMRGPQWDTWISRITEVTLDVSLPKLKLEWERSLNDDLVSLGMRDAFLGGTADFTRMSTRGRDLYINIVKQKTYVDINEEGTTAAAVTNVGIMPISAPAQFRVDRPFVFVIRERLTGTIMFMGRIVRMP